MISIVSPSQFNSSKIPKDPGVYIFKNQKNEILYIGKAKNLNLRVKSYFSKSAKPVKTQKMVLKVREIDWILVKNEVEALLLENKLIKKHKPKYNVTLKDSKTFAYIAVSKEKYPRIFSSRKTSSKQESFGPYTSGYKRRELQKVIVKVFKLRVCKKLPQRACLNYHIGLCCAPCIGKITKEEYEKKVERARSFLNGNYIQTLELLKKQMQSASKTKNYELALEFRNQIDSIKLLTQSQVVDLEKRYNQDIFAFKQLAEKMLVVQMGVRKGVLIGKKEYELDHQSKIKQEFLREYYSYNKIPHEILINTPSWSDKNEKNALEKYFSTSSGHPVKLIIPNNGNDFLLIKLAEKNIESNLIDNKTLVDLQNLLNLPVLPRTIECFDVSNIGQEHIVAGMVRFTDGNPDKKNYRRFKIKTVKKQDDLAAIKEAVYRRYNRLLKENKQLPDLILVDGGFGQVLAANNALKSLGLQVPLIGLAKKHEEIFLPNETIPKYIDKKSSIMLLLKKIRDTAHNYSLKYNIKRRQIKMREEFKLRNN